MRRRIKSAVMQQEKVGMMPQSKSAVIPQERPCMVSKSVIHPGLVAKKSGGHLVTTPFSGLPPPQTWKSQLLNDEQYNTRTAHR
jgi:hypothetical protein